MDEFELHERRLSFTAWWRRNIDRLGWNKLPPNVQGMVHDMIKRAYNSGSNYERRKHEPERLGGKN